MIRKLLKFLKKVLTKKVTQRNIIRMLTFARNTVAGYAIEMILEDISKYF